MKNCHRYLKWFIIKLLKVGLWVFNGTKVWPLNLNTTQFDHDLKQYDSVRNKFYYVGFTDSQAQIFVNDLNDPNSNYTLLITVATQYCVGCLSYLGLVNGTDGVVAFVYSNELGFTNGTIEGTYLLQYSGPQVSEVLGSLNGKVYFQESGTGYLGASDGTFEGSAIVLQKMVNSSFVYFDGKIGII